MPQQASPVSRVGQPQQSTCKTPQGGRPTDLWLLSNPENAQN